MSYVQKSGSHNPINRKPLSASMDRTDVRRMFDEGYDCSQVVLSAMSERLGISRDAALGIASGLGIGLCRGSVCGAALGGIAALGVRYGNVSPGDMVSKSVIFEKREEFLTRFKEINSSISCKELIGVEVSDLEDMISHSPKGVYRNCPGYCVNAITILEDMIPPKEE